MPGASLPEAYTSLLGLRAIREFEDRPLTDPQLHAILEAGRWTGSAKNRQKWSVVVVTDPEQRNRLAACGTFTDPVRRAPLTIALVQEPEGYEFDTGRLAQNLMLAAKAVDVASCPVTFHDSDQAAEVLSLPAGARCRYGIALGIATANARAARWGGRRPLDEFIHWNRY
jgi:nitroreductase